MATAPVSRRLNLTRDQLAAFLTDQQQIRQFELLFSTVDTLQVIVGTDFEFQADNAAATANEALAQINALSQVVDLNGPAEALSYLAELSKQVQALESAPPFSAPPAVTPASPTTSVQFNSGGAFGGSANFTYDTGTNTFIVGPAGATTTIETLAPTGATVAGNLRFLGKNASATNGAGGGITYVGGSALGTGTGGGHSFSCGGGRIGGKIVFTSANGTFEGGSMSFNSGAGNAGGTGGNFSMNAGLGATTASGGSFEMNAGNAASSGFGGSFVMTSGFSLGGAAGDFTFIASYGATANGNMYFNTDYGTVIQLTSSLLGDQQLGFYGVTPVAQPTTATTAATRVAVVGTTANIGDTYDGYTLAKVVRALRDLGILA